MTSLEREVVVSSVADDPSQTRPGWEVAVLRAAVAVLAGAALAATAAPWNQKWLLPLAVAAFVRSISGASIRVALPVGYAFGASYVLVLTVWLRAVGWDAWVLSALLVSGFYAALGAGVAALGSARGWPVWAACQWVAMETLLSMWPFGGFTWTRLAWRTEDTAWAALLPWIGATGVSFVVALCGASLCYLLMRATLRRPVVLATGFGVVVVVAAPLALQAESLTAWDWDGEQSVEVAVVQGGLPGGGRDLLAVHRQVTANHIRATRELGERIAAGKVARPDFVLWPENSTAVDPVKDRMTEAGITEAAAAVDVPVLVGAIVDHTRPDAVLNQGIVWTPGGATSERYTKRHPVPFGEYVPFRARLEHLRLGRLRMVPRDMIPGSPSAPLDLNGIQVADLICFDVAFDDALFEQVRDGAEVVTVQTSNVMFGGTAQPEQQFAITRLRAMETGRGVVVASIDGVSGAVAPNGAVLAALPPARTAVRVVSVPVSDGQTPAVVFGGALKTVLSCLGVAAGVATCVRRGSLRLDRSGRAVPPRGL